MCDQNAHIMDYIFQSFRQCWSDYYSYCFSLASRENIEGPYPLFSCLCYWDSTSCGVVSATILHARACFANNYYEHIRAFLQPEDFLAESKNPPFELEDWNLDTEAAQNSHIP